MSNGLHDLIGEAGRLRAECDYVMRLIGELESLTSNVHHLHEYEDGEILSANHVYSRSAQEHLERAGSDLSNWYAAVLAVVNNQRR